MKQNWQQIIHPTALNNNWYIVHKKDYGQYNFVSKWMFLIHILFAILSIGILIFPFIYDSQYLILISVIVTIIILAFPFIFLGVLNHKMATNENNVNINFHDNLYIGWESQQTFKPVLLLNISFIIHCILFLAVPHDHLSIVGVTLIWTLSSFETWITFICSHSVITKIHETDDKSVYKYMPSSSYITEGTITTTNTTSITGKDNVEPKALEIEQRVIETAELLKNAECFDYLMRYLATEFSMEILLSLLEIHQFQDYIMKSDKMEIVNDEIEILELTDDLPRSVIVYDEELSLNEKALKIWQKYIIEGAEYEINISWLLRNQVNEEMDGEEYKKLNEEQLLILFEKCKLEMIQLLQYSHDRFKYVEEYENIKRILLER